jgi:hypothetical protein
MSDAIKSALGYTLLPIAALACAGTLAAARAVSKTWISRLQHLASGAIVRRLTA